LAELLSGEVYVMGGVVEEEKDMICGRESCVILCSSAAVAAHWRALYMLMVCVIALLEDLCIELDI